MTETTKAIGLRIPLDIWDRLREYGIENHSSIKSKDGIDVTQTILSLLKQALNIPLDVAVVQSNNTLDSRITEIVKQRLTETSNTDNTLDSRITEIELRLESVDVSGLENLVRVNIEPLADLLAELETYTSAQFASLREQLKKQMAIV